MAHLEETESVSANLVDAAQDDPRSPIPASASKSKSKLTPREDKEIDDENDEEDDDNEVGEEYEIEGILDARRNVVKQGEYAYLVRWKGYGPEHNSWVNEGDTGNCRDLIDEFFRNKAKSQAPKPFQRTARMSASKAKGQAESPALSGKRGRGPRSSGAASKTPEVEEEDQDVDEHEEESAKRAKRKRRSSHGAANGSASTASVKAAKRSQKGDDDVSMADAANEAEDSAEPEYRYKTMKDIKLGSEKNWEKYVKEITTVEKDGDNLMLYFRTVDNHYVREPASKCAQRFPQKLIKFYEAHLRWKVAEEEVEA